jgi:hypothetical protein
MVGRFWLGGTVAVLAMAAAPTAAAQDRGEEICVSVAHIWGGSGAEVARIAVQPVPDSFRRNFFGSTCTRFSLVVESLLDWHLAFGDERSSTAALDFLATNMMPDRDYIGDLGKEVLAARAAARAEVGTRKTGRATARLSTLVEQARTDTALAGMYLRAADFYGSRALLAKAERYALPVIAVNHLLIEENHPHAPETTGGPGPNRDNFLRQMQVYEGEADRLEMHLAVLRAVLARDSGQLAAADAVLKAKEKPFYRTAAEEAHTHGDGFCDIGEREDLADYAKACKADNFELQAKDWLRMRARLDILTLSLSDDAKAARNLDWMDIASEVLRVIAIERAQDRDGHRIMGRYRDAEPEITLRLARADAMIRLAEKAPLVNNDGWGRSGLYRMALHELIATEPVASPSDTPGRFRQIANLFLDAYDKAIALEKEHPGTTYFNDPVMDRKAAYFRTVLPQLTAIAEARSSTEPRPGS